MRIALGIEYDGAGYFGWQRQREVRSIQQELEASLSIVANSPIELQCAGRTDAGVHATGQVVHFDSPVERKMAAWTLGVNANLPKQIAVRWAQPVSDDFHARFSAFARSYQYKIYHHPVRSSLKADYYLWEPRALNVDDMRSAAALLLGEHDFSCFRGSLCQAKSPIKTIDHIQIDTIEDELILNIKANAFLHHMVRNIVGTLLKIGRGEKRVEWMSQVLEGKDRKKAGPTAEPQGLYFMKAFYEEI